MRAPAGRTAATRGADILRVKGATQDHAPHARLLEGELLDLYGAILIVVPMALFLKSLWV